MERTRRRMTQAALTEARSTEAARPESTARRTWSAPTAARLSRPGSRSAIEDDPRADLDRVHFTAVLFGALAVERPSISLHSMDARSRRDGRVSSARRMTSTSLHETDPDIALFRVL